MVSCPQDMTVQDWGVTYDELEPYYDKFEYLCGISGKAGNLKGQIQDGGNPFEGPRSRDYPNPPMEMVYGPTLSPQRPRRLGHQAVPLPVGKHVASLHQSAGGHARSLHLLRFLRKIRMRQLFESQPADDDHPGADAQVKFRVAHGLRGAQSIGIAPASAPPA